LGGFWALTFKVCFVVLLIVFDGVLIKISSFSYRKDGQYLVYDTEFADQSADVELSLQQQSLIILSL